MSIDGDKIISRGRGRGYCGKFIEAQLQKVDKQDISDLLTVNRTTSGDMFRFAA